MLDRYDTYSRFTRERDAELEVAYDAALEAGYPIERMALHTLHAAPLDGPLLRTQLVLDGRPVFETAWRQDPDNQYLWHLNATWLVPFPLAPAPNVK